MKNPINFTSNHTKLFAAGASQPRPKQKLAANIVQRSSSPPVNYPLASDPNPRETKKRTSSGMQAPDAASFLQFFN